MIYRQPFMIALLLYWFIGTYFLKSSGKVLSVTSRVISFNYKALLVEVVLFILSSCFYVLGKSGLVLSVQNEIVFLKLEFFTNLFLIAIFIWFAIKDKGLTFSYPLFTMIYGKEKCEEILKKDRR